jgi:hypothetical protein
MNVHSFIKLFYPHPCTRWTGLTLYEVAALSQVLLRLTIYPALRARPKVQTMGLLFMADAGIFVGMRING